MNFVGFESFFELNSWHSSYVRQTWMAQLILAKFLCGELSSFYPRGFCYSYAYMHIWFYRFCKRVTCFCTRLIFRKHLELLFMFSTGFIQFLLFYLPVTFFADSFDAISINMQEILVGFESEFTGEFCLQNYRRILLDLNHSLN